MRLLLIDDQPLFVEGMRLLLAELDASAQCVTAVSITEALQAAGPFDMVELGAPMMVASTMVPVLTFTPRACNSLPTWANSASPSLLSFNTCETS